MKDSEHLQWIHDRLVNAHGENPDVDYLIRLRGIIARLKNIDGEQWATEYKGKDWKDEVLEKEPEYFNPETQKTQKLFAEETLIPTWTVRYEDPTRGNKGEAVYMTVSAKDYKEAQSQALACYDFNKHILPEHYDAKYLSAFRASGNYKIGEVEYFEGDPRL